MEDNKVPPPPPRRNEKQGVGRGTSPRPPPPPKNINRQDDNDEQDKTPPPPPGPPPPPVGVSKKTLVPKATPLGGQEEHPTSENKQAGRPKSAPPTMNRQTLLPSSSSSIKETSNQTRRRINDKKTLGVEFDDDAQKPLSSSLPSSPRKSSMVAPPRGTISKGTGLFRRQTEVPTIEVESSSESIPNTPKKAAAPTKTPPPPSRRQPPRLTDFLSASAPSMLKHKAPSRVDDRNEDFARRKREREAAEAEKKEKERAASSHHHPTTHHDDEESLAGPSSVMKGRKSPSISPSSRGKGKGVVAAAHRYLQPTFSSLARTGHAPELEERVAHVPPPPEPDQHHQQQPQPREEKKAKSHPLRRRPRPRTRNLQGLGRSTSAPAVLISSSTTKESGEEEAAGDNGSFHTKLLEDLLCDWESLNFSSDESAAHPHRHHPDNSWILGQPGEGRGQEQEEEEATTAEDVKEEEEEEPTKKKDPDSKPPPKKKGPSIPLSPRLKYLFKLLWLLSFIGRFPFVVKHDKKTGTIKVSLRCKWARRVEGWLTALLLSFLFVLIVYNAVAVFWGNSENDAYLKLEQLLLQKHWLYVIMFLLSYVVVLAGSFSFLCYKRRIRKFLNDLVAIVVKLDYPEDINLNLAGILYGYIFISVMDVVLMVALVIFNVYGFRESQWFEGTLVFRCFTKKAFTVMKYWNYVLLPLEIYIYLLARNYLFLIMTVGQCVRNSGGHWYARCVTMFITRFPLYESPLSEEEKKTLCCPRLLQEHWAITRLLRGLSSQRFIAIFMTFFCAKVFCLPCILFKLATGFVFDLRLKNVGQKVEGTEVLYNQSEREQVFEVAYFLLTSTFALWLFCVIVSEAGEVVTGGFEPIRRYGLVFCKNTMERKFIMSMYMSFNGRNTHYVKPGNYFVVNKAMFVSILAFGASILVVMLSCNVSNLVESPIVLPCDSGPGLCVKNNVQRDTNPGESFQKNNEKGVEKIVAELTTPGVTTNPTTSSSPVVTTPTIIITTTEEGLTTTTEKPKTEQYNIISKDNYKKVNEERFKCGFYCMGTQVFRDGSPQNLYKDWNKKDTLIDCIGYTYKAYVRHGTVITVTNCNGVQTNKLDTYRRYRLTVGNGEKVSTPLFNDKKYCCFDYDTKSSHYRHSLEDCGMPFAIKEVISHVFIRILKGTGCDTSRTDPYDDDLHDEFVNSFNSQLIYLWSRHIIEKSLFPDVTEANFICNQKDKKDSDWRAKTVDPRNDTDLFVHFTHDFIEYHRLRVFTPGGKEVPFLLTPGAKIFDWSDGSSPKVKEEKVKDITQRLRDYAYASYLPLPFSTNPSVSTTVLSFGLHDCFGHGLREFDDCGGLGFSILKGDGKIYRPKKTDPKDMDLVQIPGRPDYKCWKSWIPNYTCGVPDIQNTPGGTFERNEKLIGQLCEAWKLRAKVDWSGKSM